MFNLDLDVSDIDGHAIVALRGELDLSDAPDMAAHLIAAVAACGPRVIVDLAGLTFIDSCGLGTLMRVLRWTRQSGGDLTLVAPQHQVRRVLEVTGLIDVFTVYPSMTPAISGAADPALAGPSDVAAAPRTQLGVVVINGHEEDARTLARPNRPSVTDDVFGAVFFAGLVPRG
jgi:anti-sigma B factor antagonist